MGKVKVKVKNETRITVMIQEGNAGVFATRRVLKSTDEFTLTLDGNATYREYVLITLPNNTPIDQMFSSDDVAEFKEIVIKEREITKKDDSGKNFLKMECFWEGILRGEDSVDAKSWKKQPASPAADQAVVEPASSPAADQAVVAPASSPAADQAVVAPASSPAANQAAVVPASSPAADQAMDGSRSMSWFQKLKNKFS